MEQTNASEEIIIQEIAMEVESEFQLGGLSDGLYFTFAAEVAKRYALLAVSKERERVASKIDEVWSLLCQMDTNIKSEKEYAKDIINLINTK